MTRKRQTFMLTVLSNEPEERSSSGDVSYTGDTSFVGQIKVISSGKVLTFTSLQELIQLISSEMTETCAQKEDTSALQPKNTRYPPPDSSTDLA